MIMNHAPDETPRVCRTCGVPLPEATSACVACRQPEPAGATRTGFRLADLVALAQAPDPVADTAAIVPAAVDTATESLGDEILPYELTAAGDPASPAAATDAPAARLTVGQMLERAATAERSTDSNGPPDLDTLPVAIEVVHEPAHISAQRKGPSGRKYSWVYRTTVRSRGGPVVIIEFGAFVREGARWVLSNTGGRPRTQRQFAEWYGCPDGVLQPGEDYSDPENWSGSDTLRNRIKRWYFIGIDDRGRRVKGEAVCEELEELFKPPPKPAPVQAEQPPQPPPAARSSDPPPRAERPSADPAVQKAEDAPRHAARAGAGQSGMPFSVVVVVLLLVFSGFLTLYGVVDTLDSPARLIEGPGRIDGLLGAALFVQTLVLIGVVGRSRMAWSGVNLFSVIVVFGSLALLGVVSYTEAQLKSLNPVAVGAFVWWLTMFLCMQMPTTTTYFNLKCPECGRRGRPADLLQRKMKCRRCKTEW
jgi:hypothetical protein